ncbi:orotidine-5'-phosphate decarboxylase [bacterium]|nr:orotidine-5'-phosphate decarboxylase [bacterium]
MKSKIFVALDVETKEKALEIVGDLKGLGACFKIGKQLFTSTGPELVREIVGMGEDVFLDLKYHDIPNTVVKAGVAAAELGVKIFNVHASGGRKMMEAVRSEMDKIANPPLVLAVTILTSLGEEDIREVGFDRTIPEQIAKLAKLAKDSGMDGVVASPLEIELIRETCGKDFKILTPGIRPAFAAVNDQKRIATPAEALRKGADYLVIGRPITAAENRREAFLKILEECKNA